MSKLNIQRAVDNIRLQTTVFTPIVEAVVNAIDAIDAARQVSGIIRIKVRRSVQQVFDNDHDHDNDGDGAMITDVEICDNGIGFTQPDRDSFDTLYSARKVRQGGKGFGRLTYLRYFDQVLFDSVHLDGHLMRRQFSMGKDKEFIENEKSTVATGSSTGSSTVFSTGSSTGTRVSLIGEKSGKLPKKLTSIARGLVELLLPYFTTHGYMCPRIELAEHDGQGLVVLNDYVDSPGAIIHEVALDRASFTLQGASGPQQFDVRVFKILSPQNKVSKLSLVAHRREVTETSLAGYIPEFAEDFVETLDADTNRTRNYILKAYVFGAYLDASVQLERGGFSFLKDSELLMGISQSDIEAAAAEITRSAVEEQVRTRQQTKYRRVQAYVDEHAPWYKPLMPDLDTTGLTASATASDMDALLARESFRREALIRKDVAAALASNDPDELIEQTRDLANRISESSKNELVHYVALRRQVLELFDRSLEVTREGAYSAEEAVHSIIFPTKTNSDSVEHDSHNLWILDERLTFTSYLACDVPLDGGRSPRPDIVSFDRPAAFRAENEFSNPVTIFEFKRPGRDDFANPASKDDPVEQVVRYVNAIRAGKFKTPKGREIQIRDTTPFYGYVVCDLSAKVKDWLFTNKDFKPMPDGLGYFNRRGNINLYIEVLSWSKLMKDARMRNRAFFHKLGVS